jgi:RpiB/LacA/LacB family sugar-phosphate isomerase
MNVAVASDHAGFLIKKVVIEAVRDAGHQAIDLGTHSTESVDYVDYVEKLTDSITCGESERGIMLCGSGVGACITANKIKGIYASVCHDSYSAHQGVEHDAMNVLCLGGRIIGSELVKELVPVFLSARFIGNDPGEERHTRRVKKTRKIEERNMGN